jgi:NADH:ubiquinone oxidoreductase subunit 6 (subunit J)
MTATVLLRVAAIISLLFTAGHTMGGFKKWSPMGDNPVLKAMMDVHFETMGASRSYLDFFMGFGWSLSVAMLLQSILLWQIANLARADAVRVRPMIAVFALAQLAGGIIAWRFIFPVPALFSVVLLVALVAAFVVAR